MLSKSDLLAYRQCERRLWLQIHRPELGGEAASTLAAFGDGNRLGAMARRLYDAAGTGVLIDVRELGVAAAIERTGAALEGRAPVFEAGFQCEGVVAFADVLLPVEQGWRMVEIKSSSGVKDYHREDLAIQRWVAEGAGVRLHGVSIAHINTAFVYEGDGRYEGLLTEVDLSEDTAGRMSRVTHWVHEARRIAVRASEPVRRTGAHCASPSACPFIGHCAAREKQPEHPVAWLPDVSVALRKKLEQDGIEALREVPDAWLSPRQRRVKDVTLSGLEWLDPAAAGRLPDPGGASYFLDFEAVGFAIPIWAGTRPFEQIPFQFSLHKLGGSGEITHSGFLDLEGDDPSRRFAEALIARCGESGPIYVYNLGTEGSHIARLARQFPDLAAPLRAIHARLVDLLPIAREHYYHPAMKGKWSLKNVVVALDPALAHASLAGVNNGLLAQQAYLEAIDPQTGAERREQIRAELERYCERDTWAMVVVREKLAGGARRRR